MWQAVSAPVADAKRGCGFCLFTINLDHCAKLRSNPQFQDAYRCARYVTADGFPIALLGRLHGFPVRRTTGADLLTPLCAQAACHRLPVFLLGPSTEVLRRVRAQLSERMPRLQVVDSYAPGPNFDPHALDADLAIQRIRRSGARLCFIALGAPRQEIFAARCHAQMPEIGFICVGAALDFLAGNQTRAPRFFRDHGLEWLWRLLSDPRRLALRYLRCAAIFPRLAAEVIPQAISARLGRA
ncbi:MAG TPA: WecB/TagA/CpsF family glycosyltransferase [Pseudolabrys sp.]|nr:WecB/TagA/CpsF family glycosyltransferase [Pseudolabrys sp.]